MTNPFPLTARPAKNPTRMMQQGVWLLLVVAVSLLFVLRRAGSLGSGSLWILGCAVAAFLLSLGLRDVIHKLSHRHTEDKLVKDVKAFLETEQPVEFRPAVYVAPAISQSRVEEEEKELIPQQATNFVPMCRDITVRTPGDDLVVFDAITPRPSVEVRMNFYAILTPVC